MSWSVHLARRHPVKAIISLLLVASATAAGCFFAGPYVALFAAVALVMSLSDFLFPVRYFITPNGASCRMLLKSSEIKWAEVRRCYVDDCGVKLSPLDYTSRVEAFRGVFLRFGENQDEVIEAVKSARARHAELSSASIAASRHAELDSASPSPQSEGADV